MINFLNLIETTYFNYYYINYLYTKIMHIFLKDIFNLYSFLILII